MVQQEQKTQDGGFVLPPPGDNQDTQVTVVHSSSTHSETLTTQQAELQIPAVLGLHETSPRDTLIGGAILLVLFIGFFFARIGYANMLVRKRVAPAKANAAGWWLFVFLASLATAVVLAALNPLRFLAPMFMVPLGGLTVVGLILTLVTGRR